MTFELVKSVSIENLVAQRLGIVERLRKALALLDEAEKIAADTPIKFPALLVENGHRHGLRLTGDYSHPVDAEKEMLRCIDASAWNYLLEESGLKTFMDAATRSRWGDQIRKGDIPELTTENIISTFGQLYDARADMFESGVIKCFRKLSWDYKTNLPCKFGKRIIVHLFNGGWPNSRTTDELDDLMRVFFIMDGRPEPDHRDGMYHQIIKCHEKVDGMENDYLKIRWYQKGTAHITFKRPELVEQMNLILAKHHPNALASR